MENETLSKDNHRLDKSYKSVNNQILIFQTKVAPFKFQLNSIVREIKFISDIKNNLLSEKELLTKSNGDLNDIARLINKLKEELEERITNLKNYSKTLNKEISQYKIQKGKINSENLKQVNIND